MPQLPVDNYNWVIARLFGHCTVILQLFNVMHQTIHQPLRIHLQLASVTKMSKSLCGIDVTTVPLTFKADSVDTN
jgi:hypothetical protein